MFLPKRLSLQIPTQRKRLVSKGVEMGVETQNRVMKVRNSSGTLVANKDFLSECYLC